MNNIFNCNSMKLDLLYRFKVSFVNILKNIINLLIINSDFIIQFLIIK